MKPTIVLVHGAFAESSSWDRVMDPLLDAGHPVIAVANPLRGLALDAAAVADVVSVSHPDETANQILEAAAVHAAA
jgi:pimeloyl-ACP methyl ester carboxylesterase